MNHHINFGVMTEKLAVVPFMGAAATFMFNMATSQTSRAAASYAKAGGIVYTTVSQIRTILSLNAVETMIGQYTEATQEAYDGATKDVMKFGFANGAMMSSFLLSYVPVVLYGSYLVYSAVQTTGCDPSSSQAGNEACNPAGEDVFGALFGITFAGSVLPQITGTSWLATGRFAGKNHSRRLYRNLSHIHDSLILFVLLST